MIFSYWVRSEIVPVFYVLTVFIMIGMGFPVR